MNVIERHATISQGILRVREIIRTSQYPNCHPEAQHHLEICDQTLRDALVKSEPEIAERLFTVCENALKAAEEIATKKKAAQENLLSDLYKVMNGYGDGKSASRGGIYI